MKHLFMDIARHHCPNFIIENENRRQIADIFRWCMMLPGAYNPQKGLWLWGNIGTGKSTMLLIIKDFCKIVRPRENGWPYSFKIESAPQICLKFSSEGYGGINDYIESNRLAIDELGAETLCTGYYGTSENVLQHILQRRYERRFASFTHVTTNLSVEKVMECYGARVYDRCREMFNFVEFPGKSFRSEQSAGGAQSG